MREEKKKDISEQIRNEGIHKIPDSSSVTDHMSNGFKFCNMEEMKEFQKIFPTPIHVHILKSLDDLLRRDERRKEDGFPKKIRLGKIIKPSKEGKKKVVVVPTVVEEKLIHDSRPLGEEAESGGSGDAQEGDVIGEEQIHSSQEGDEIGAGQGGESLHEIESTAYDLGRVLTEKFKLPNLKDKGKKRSLTKYTYDLTDMNRGFGQFLDKKATLKKIIETNLALGNISPATFKVDPNNLLVAPRDKIYRTLSKEKDYESQAVVFFMRDYSGSMHGKPTDLVVSQHLFIYSWLMYQYESNVVTRFILHDDKAKEVEDFYTYHNTSVAGGTRVAAGYKLINEIVLNENLIVDYNIYIFQGTDGGDWDTDGREAIIELKKILGYINRIGVSIAQNSYTLQSESVVERYLKRSGILKNSNLIRLDSLKSNSDQDRIIEGIRKMVS